MLLTDFAVQVCDSENVGGAAKGAAVKKTTAANATGASGGDGHGRGEESGESEELHFDGFLEC